MHHSDTEPSGGAVPSNSAQPYPDIHWEELQEHERVTLDAGWPELDLEGSGRWFNTYPAKDRWEMICTLKGRDGSHDAAVEGIAANADPKTNAALDKIVEDEKYGRIVLKRASEFEIQPVRWLWQDRIPLRELTILAGREDRGKSTVALWFAAQITRGELPGEFYGEPRDVLICAAEDSWEQTVCARLVAAGADMLRVHCVEIKDGGGPDITVDLEGIRHALEETNAALLIFDPLTSNLGPRTDINKPEVRSKLIDLKRLAQDTGCAVLAVLHLRKGSGNDANEAIQGSGEFKNVARCVLLAIQDQEDPDLKILGVSKLNLGPKPPPQRYKLIGQTLETEDGPISTGKVEWLDEVAHSIDELWIASQSIDGDETLTAQDEAVEWLRDYLSDGEKESGLTKSAAKEENHSTRTLQRARTKLRVKINKEGRYSYWSLPQPVPTTLRAEKAGTGGTGGTGHDSQQNPSTHTHANTYLPSGDQPVPPVPPLRGTGTNHPDPTLTAA